MGSTILEVCADMTSYINAAPTKPTLSAVRGRVPELGCSVQKLHRPQTDVQGTLKKAGKALRPNATLVRFRA